MSANTNNVDLLNMLTIISVDAVSSDSKAALSGGYIAMIVILVVFFCCCVALGIFGYFKYRQREQKRAQAEEDNMLLRLDDSAAMTAAVNMVSLLLFDNVAS